MISRFDGVGTVVLTAITATCGLLMLTGVGPTATSEAPLPAAAPSSTEATTTTTEASDDDTMSSTTTSTTTSTATTTTTSSTTMTLPPPPIPLSVTASDTIVGAGGTITFDGTCAVVTGGPLGPVIVWIVGETTTVVDTGITSEAWRYTWTAPTTEEEFGSFTFQFWCGDPTGFDVGYPAGLQQRVDMVATDTPPTTTVLVESDAVAPTIPETD